jgi:DNA (cytosine-5)-methyltransferase 1
MAGLHLRDVCAGVVGGMRKLRLLDLFSGAGMFSLGLERTERFETVGFCDINPASRALLAHHWPGVPIYEDVTTLEPFGPVDMVTAGFPCQDISLAGKGAGITGDRSGLFWHVIRTALLAGRPKLMLENVAALLRRGMGVVLGALADCRYSAQWDCVSASDVGAPHGRNRLWIIADPERDEQSWPEPCFGQVGRVGRFVKPLAWDGGWEAALSTLRGMDDGLARSVDRTDLCRNGIVPQVVTEIGRAYLESIGETA